MGRIVKGYTEDEIASMADYFGALPYAAAKQEFDAAAVDKGASLHEEYCEKCHSEAGTVKDDEAGYLAGQWSPYLKWTLEDFNADHRKAPKKMKKKLDDLMAKEGADGLHAIISFYASKQ
jgi:sulfide dehydrogenase cytochrome subunit